MKKEPKYDYKTMGETITSFYGMLLQIKEGLSNSVKTYNEMQSLCRYVSSICGGRPLPFDCGDEDGRIADMDLCDEAFALELSKILHNKSGFERCIDLGNLAKRLLKEISSFKSKHDKLDNTIKLLPRETAEDRVMYHAQLAARKRVADALANRRGKLEFLIRKYLRQRKANILRQIGIDEKFYAAFDANDECIDPVFFKDTELYPHLCSFKVNDEKVSGARKKERL